MTAALTLFLIAGEPSGDRLGAALMAGVRQLVAGVQFAGVGGPMMQAQGLDSLFAMEELSVMGIAEVMPKFFALRRRIAQTAGAVTAIMVASLITCTLVAAIPAISTVGVPASSVIKPLPVILIGVPPTLRPNGGSMPTVSGNAL